MEARFFQLTGKKYVIAGNCTYVYSGTASNSGAEISVQVIFRICSSDLFFNRHYQRSSYKPTRKCIRSRSYFLRMRAIVEVIKKRRCLEFQTRPYGRTQHTLLVVWYRRFGQTPNTRHCTHSLHDVETSS